MKVGSKVKFRGRFAKDYSRRGVIEEVRNGKFAKDNDVRSDVPDTDPLYGVRLENGNFSWAAADQLQPGDQ